MKTLAILSQDTDAVRDIRELLNFFPEWELREYDNMESAWLDFFKREPNLTIVDLDMLTKYKSNNDRRRRINERAPFVVFISSESILPADKYEWIYTVRVLEYLQKPLDIDRLLFVLALIQGPETKGEEQ
jgi:DNA-binding NtrC family response regulator